MAKGKQEEMDFLDDFHAIQGNVLICNKAEYRKYPINPASALEVCPLCKSLLPSAEYHVSLKCDVIVNAPTSRHLIKRESIFCPSKGADIRIGMGSACEICPECGIYL